MFPDGQFILSSLFSLFVVTWQNTHLIYRSTCRRDALFKTTNRNQILVGNSGSLLSSIRVRNLPFCVRQCILRTRCSSINYKTNLGSDQGSNCQLLSIKSSSTDATFSSLAEWIHSEPVSKPGPRCAISPCSPGYRCTDTCDVSSGYRCTEINECESNPCVNGGVCRDYVNRFLCLCPRNYMGSRCHLGNIALNRPTAHSSIWDGFDSSGRAVNGQTGTDYSAGYCSHTGFQYQPWWRVDLGTTYSIGTVKVTNRGDFGANRLEDFLIYVGYNTGSVRANSLCNRCYGYPSLGATVTLSCSSTVIGRYVFITLPGSQYLTLCEVLVFTRE